MNVFGRFCFLLILVTGIKVSAQSVTYSALYNNSTFDAVSIDLSKPVGAIDGNAGTSSGGTATYTIPIECPPGTNSMVPKLSINYNSGASSRLLGLGWGLSGLSVITRAGSDIMHDYKGGPYQPLNIKTLNYTNDDAFVLDGSRLEPVTGNNGADGTVYRKENEDFSTITSYSTTGPAWFKVVTKEGIEMEFGNTPDSRANMDWRGTIAWRLNKISDIHGNFVKFEYDNSGWESRIVAIKYTGNDGTKGAPAMDPYNVITFKYQERADVNTFYDGNAFSREQKYLVQEIEIKGEGGELFTRYQFNYGKDDFNSYLKSIKKIASDGTSLNETVFKYGESSAPMTTTYPELFTTGFKSIMTSDFNGDGLADFLIAEKPNNELPVYHTRFLIKSRSAGSSTYVTTDFRDLPGDRSKIENTNSYVATNAHNFRSSDFNGDGINDIIITDARLVTTAPGSGITGRIVDAIKIYYMNSSAQIADSQTFAGGNVNPENQFLFIGDFDGDGSSDFIFLYKDASGVVQARVTCPAGSHNVGLYGSRYYTGDVFRDMYDNSGAAVGGMLTTDFIDILDINGDGRDEIMLRDKISGGHAQFFSVDFLNSGGFNKNVQLTWMSTQSFPTANHQMYFGDFNGDGNIDVLAGPDRDLHTDTNTWQIGYSDGTGFANQVSNITFDHVIKYEKGLYDATDELLIGDFNGDGKSDIYDSYHKTASLAYEHHIYYSQGKTFVLKKEAAGNLAAAIPVVGDFNGDGKSDVFAHINGDGANCRIFSFNPFTTERLLHKVKDGLGRVTEFQMEPLTKGGNLYTKNYIAAYPVNTIQPALYVASSMMIPDGIGGISITTYHYENLKSHKAGRGLLGFDKIISSNAVSNIRTESLYGLNTTYYVPYLQQTVVSLANGGGQLSNTVNTYNLAAAGTDYSFFMQLTDVLQQDLLTGANITTHSTYDAYGNITQAVSDINSGLETVTTNTTFIASPSSAILSLPSSVTTMQQRSGQRAVSKIITYGYTGWKPTKITEFSGMVAALDKVLEYDVYGNIKSEQKQQALVSAALWPKTEYIYDPKGRFRISEKNPLGQMSYASYHNLWGKPVSETTVSGVVTTYDYDAWGKLIQANMPGPYAVTYSDAWEISGNKRYYTLVQHPGAPDVKTWYDEQGRILQEDAENYGGSWATSNTGYDARGNAVTTVSSHLPSETPETTTNTYDDYNRPVTSVSVFGTTTYNYSYGSGNTTVTITKPSGQATSKTTDAAGKVVSSADNGGNMLFTYDSWGNQLTARHDARSGVMILNKYDDYGRKTSMTDVDAGTTSYTYNNLHQLKDETDAKGSKYIYAYDVMGRVITRTPAGGVYAPSSYYYFGAAKNNQLQRVEIGLTITSYDYDTRGRLILDKLQTPGRTMNRSYSYNIYGQNIGTVYSSGLNILRTYDGNGYLQTVKTNNPGTPPVLLFNALSMNGKGQYTAYRKANGLASSVNYQFGIPTHYATAGIQDLEMNFDWSSGNLLARRDNIAGYEEHFAYDNLDRLISSQINKLTFPPASYLSQSVNYDAVGGAPAKSLGNIMSKSDAGMYYYSPISKVHGVLRIDPPLGAISHSTQEVTYSVFNKTASIKENSYEQTYAYDGNDERYFGELKNGGITERLRWYFGDYEIDQVMPGGTERHIHYIAGGDGLCAIVVKEGSSFQSYAAYTDHLGSILRLTDVSGSTVAIQNYDAWGRERNPMDWTYTLGIGGLKPDWLYRGYTGHEMLPKFDLINMNARLYDPVNARMLRPDNNITYPFSTQSYNRYSYAMNNPMSYTDPDGNNPLIALAVGMAFSALDNAWQAAHNGGNVMDAVMGGLATGAWKSMMGSAVGFGIGEAFQQFNLGGSVFGELGRAAVHGAANYAISGGKSSAFYSGAMGSLAGSLTGVSGLGEAFQDPVGSTIFAAGVGGITSGIAGGSFLSGAGSAAVMHMSNQLMHKGTNQERKSDIPPREVSSDAVGAGLSVGTLTLEKASRSIGIPGVAFKMKNTGRALGGVGNVVGAGALLNDYNDYKTGQNEMTSGKLAYHAAGFFVPLYVGARAGGPVGFVVGGSFVIAEASYNGLKWFGDQLSTGAANFNYQLSKGWIPGR